MRSFRLSVTNSRSRSRASVEIATAAWGAQIAARLSEVAERGYEPGCAAFPEAGDVEDLDPVVEGVGHVESSAGVRGRAVRAVQLAGPEPQAAKGADLPRARARDVVQGHPIEIGLGQGQDVAG